MYLFLIPCCLSIVALRLLDGFYRVELRLWIIARLLDDFIYLPSLVGGVVKIEAFFVLAFAAVTRQSKMPGTS